MNLLPRNFKHLLIVVGAAIALPLAAQGEPAPDGARERCAGPMIASSGHMHDGMKSDAMLPRGEFTLNGRPPMDSVFMPGVAPMPPFFRDVTLTEMQQDKIFATLHASAPTLREQGKLAKKSADAMRELADSGSYDESKLKSLADTNARANADLMLMQARDIHQILALLSPEQRKQVDAIKTKLEDRHALRAQIEAVKAKFDAPECGDK